MTAVHGFGGGTAFIRNAYLVMVRATKRDEAVT